MLAKIRLVLDAKELDYKKSSRLQGILFEQMDRDYGDKLHQQNLHPYSQYFCREEDKAVWYVSALNREAREQIIEPLMDSGFSAFQFDSESQEIHILEKQLTTIPKSSLLERFYHEQARWRIQLRFLSPTAFRQKGTYNILPDIRLIFQSLMLRYQSVGGEEEMFDEETLEQLSSMTLLTRYRIWTKAFPMEGRAIPGFMGEITMRFTGPDTLARFARLLLVFGEYSGVGIKTGMGMGAFRIHEEVRDSGTA